METRETPPAHASCREEPRFDFLQLSFSRGTRTPSPIRPLIRTRRDLIFLKAFVLVCRSQIVHEHSLDQFVFCVFVPVQQFKKMEDLLSELQCFRRR